MDEYSTAELGRPPAGRLTPGMGTLAGELCQCAADAEVIGAIATSTHVLHTGLGVWGRIHQRCTRAPGFRVDHLFAYWALSGVIGRKFVNKKNNYELFFPGP